jgi:transcriptional regulator GlxA family with amidase domain
VTRNQKGREKRWFCKKVASRFVDNVQNGILSEMCSAAIALEASPVVIPRLLKLLIVWQKTIDVLRFCQQQSRPTSSRRDRKHAEIAMYTIAIMAYDAVNLFQLGVATEIFGVERAELKVPWYRLLICATEPGPVRTSTGLLLNAPYHLEHLAEADTIIVPSSPRFRTTAAPDDLLEALRTAYQRGTRVISFCTGAFLLAAAAVARRMVVPLHREGGQAQYIETPFPDLDENDPFGATLAWIAAHLDREFTIEQLAAQAAMSQRTFARRFSATLGMTPYQWILQQRIVLAQRLLETTNKPVEQIATCCGFHSAATLRLHFQRFLRISPQAYRHTFQQKQGERRIECDPGDK